MIFTTNELFVNVSWNDTNRYFDIEPDLIYLTRLEATTNRVEGERTITLREALKEIYKNIHEDS